MHGGADAVTGDIDEIGDCVVFVQIPVAEGVAAQLGRWLIEPVGTDGAVRDGLWKQRLNVAARLVELTAQLYIALDVPRRGARV